MGWTWFFYFLVLLISVVLLLTLYCKQRFEYWKKLNIPHTNPKFPLGDFQDGGFSETLGLFFKKLYEGFPEERFFGIWLLLKPVLVVRDPELIKMILVKDFMAFHDRGVYYNEKDDPLSAHLFSVEGIKWKNIRVQLSPTFTSGKMKMMFPMVLTCGEVLKEFLKEPARREEVVDMKDLIARFMTDVISICAFGIETNSLKNPDAIFRKMGKKSVEPNLRNMFVSVMQLCLPKYAEAIRMRVFRKDVAKFFLEAVKEVMDYRENNNVNRNDFMQLLIQLKNKGTMEGIENNGETLEAGKKLTLEEAAAEAFVFFLAGFETSSATVQFALYELAINPVIQEKLRNEIYKTFGKQDGQLTYEGIHSIPYLDKVIEETLRKYPVVPTLIRECNRDYNIPESNVIIPKGTAVHIPIYGIQMDPKYFPDPEKFDPERFSETEKQKRHNYTYLPFGEGPRNCIGKRFGQMQIRVALIILLQNYKFELSKNITSPIKFDVKAFILLPKGGIPLKISPV